MAAAERRKTKRRRIDRRSRLPERFYRDIWLFVLSGFVLWASIGTYNASQDAARASHRANDAAVAAKRAAAKANANVALIQRSRIDITRQNCRDQNRNHDRTIARITAIVARIQNPVQRAAAQAGLATTISIIDALAPKRDCEALVGKLIPPAATPGPVLDPHRPG